MTETLELIQPDDWHVHLRDEAMLQTVLPYTARQMGRAIIMPNLTPPVTTVDAAEAYRGRIMAALQGGSTFEPLMTLYLTDNTDADDLAHGFESGAVTAAKLYPAGATTNSDAGVTDVSRIDDVLKVMAEIGMPLLVHGEVTHPGIDIFDREAVFIETVLTPMLERHAGLRCVLEHITTRQAVEFVRRGDDRLAATITPHHMQINRTDLFRGGIRPHLYCLPIAKREEHRAAVREAATSGNTRFFLGTDTAPHPRHAKEAACGCAGIFNAAHAIELYAGMFAEDGALDQLESFASINGPYFYRLPVNSRKIRLSRTGSPVPEEITVLGGEGSLTPFRAGETLSWKLDEMPAGA